MAADIPVVVTAAGAQPTPPADLLAQLIAAVSAQNPGYTVLPAGLIEDISSTDVGALVIADTARVETINSLTPTGANDFLLLQLGQQAIGPEGGAPGVPSNTSVFVIFTALDPNTSAPLPGLPIGRGVTVSDGTYQYVVQDGGVTDTNGHSPALFCLATISGSWTVSTNTVTTVQTSFPNTVAITCTNPQPGLPGAAAETASQFRARVLRAQLATSTGTPELLKTLLGNVAGVQQRLVSTRQVGAGWEVIVGGGDPYQVAGAIFASGLDVSTLVGSTLSVTNITNANPGVVTTDLNHNYANGQQATINGVVGMTPINGIPFTVTVVDEKRFSLGIDTTGYPHYISGGVVTPNLRNVTPSIFSPPDVYVVPFVIPPQQTVTMTATYSTTNDNFTSQAAVAQLAAPALADYVNSIIVGAPMSLLLMEQTFTDAVSSVLDPTLLSDLQFAVQINGVSTAPTGKLIFGDPESYFFATSGGMSVEES